MEFGREHPVCNLIQRFREIFLRFGLNEVINPVIIDERDVYLQYGEEAPLILDRVYYLAALDRPDIGLSKERLERIKEIIPDFDIRKREILQGIFRRFKEGKIESDDFVEVLVHELSIMEYQALDLIDIFPEFRELRPVPTKKTLRSHMTALWYKTLASLQDRDELPIRLFSIGYRFRREQRQDARHLFESNSSSIVIMDPKFSLKDGFSLTSNILKELGFTCNFKQKDVTSHYYQEGTDTEVYIDYEGEEIEVANLGFYSKRSLSNYGIRYPVFNVGFGVERLAMVLSGIHDIRALVYPQFCKEEILMDEEIAKTIGLEKEPKSTEGKELVNDLIDSAISNRNKIGPVEVLGFEGRFLERDIKVWIYNWDEGKELLSKATFNEVWVYNGSIAGLPKKEKVDHIPESFLKIYENGINTHLRFIDLIIKRFVSELEINIKKGERSCDLRFKMIKGPREINLKIPDRIYQYISSHNKKILIGGPLFFGIKAELF
ncbi:MAG: O-phosphoserine--tRNA ligase [bacterium]|nr:O-phosphoserine--tRNA ligase [bacterium]